MEDYRIAAAYIRVSTEEQTEYSPDAQLVEIRAYADSHHFLLPDEFVFVDQGISGKHTGTRPAFQKMIGTAKRKPRPFDAVLLWKFSRFARNREDSIVYKSMLRRQLGIEVISISEPLADDKTSILMEAIIEAMDEYYSINLAEEVKRGMTEKARRGELQSAPPFGYRVQDGVLVPHPEESALVVSLFQRFASGESLFALAKWLNTMGFTTRRGGRFENRTIEYILRNPAYIGKLRWNPSGHTRRDFDNENLILADARHKPLIPPTLWNTVQTRMEQVKVQHKYHGRPLSEHRDWITGLLRCSRCGSTLVFAKPHYWKCNGYARGSCQTSQHITDEKIRGMVLARLEYDSNDASPLSFIVTQSKSEPINEETLLLEQKKQLTARLLRLREAYLSGVEDLSGYASAKRALEEQISQISARLDALSQPKDTTKAEQLLCDPVCRCAQVLSAPSFSLDAKKRIAHGVIERCVFDKSSNCIQIYYQLLLP